MPWGVMAPYIWETAYYRPEYEGKTARKLSVGQQGSLYLQLEFTATL